MVVPTNGMSLPLRRGRDPPNPVVSPRVPRIHLAVIFLLISCWMSLGAAISLDSPPRPTETALLIDTRIPVFVDGHWQIMSEEDHRQLHVRGAASNVGATTTIAIDVSTVTADPTSTTTTASPLPSPFDGALSANFSNDDACPDFINNFLANSTFQSCYPVSILLQSSTSFFQAEKSLVAITQTLDHACEADVNSCTTFLSSLADEMISDGNCRTDWKEQNALVTQAYYGMKNYNTVYKATCLMDEETSLYCFADAVTNSTTASNAYLYYLPFNSSLPETAAPSCNQCTSQTMGIYQAATSDRDAMISYTYEGAADQVNSICGTEYVNTTLAAVTNGNTAGTIHQPSPLLLLSFLAMGLAHWIL
ncbi:hypothetical protein F5Y15DRAFT_144701 [Xylariaceae sp. FL0016]|nr:hypothetical protein F5Y15DRAFT_144701 [Xylariaceae sp. FL0016]